MTDREETVEAGDTDGHEEDTIMSTKKAEAVSLLDSGEDFEMLDEEDIDDEPPPLEDAGGGEMNKTMVDMAKKMMQFYIIPCRLKCKL